MLSISKHSALALVSHSADEPGRRYSMHAVRFVPGMTLGEPSRECCPVDRLAPDAPEGAGQLIATDGRRLLVVPVASAIDSEGEPIDPETPDVDGYLSRETLKAAGAGSKVSRPMACISANGAASVREGFPAKHRKAGQPDPERPLATFERPELGDFPRVSAVIEPRESYGTAVTVNARYLAEAVQAVGGPDGAVRIMLSLEHPQLKAVRIEHAPTKDDPTPPAPGALALVMPIAGESVEDRSDILADVLAHLRTLKGKESVKLAARVAAWPGVPSPDDDGAEG